MLTPEQFDLAAQRYLAGESTKAVAVSFGVPEPTLRRALVREGVWRQRVSSGPKRNFSPEEERRILDRYLGGESALAIAKSLSLGRTTIQRTIERLGGETREELIRSLPLTEEQKIFAVQECLAGATCAEMAEVFATSDKTISRALREYAVKLKSWRPRSCTVDESAFDVITPVSARWIGFFCADGALPKDTSGQQSIAFNISAKDRAHLEKLRDFLGSNHAITEIVTTEKVFKSGQVIRGGLLHVYYYKVRSNRLSSALIARGMIKDKGPERVPNAELEDMPAFWAGTVDGDGSIGINRGYPDFSLCGHMPLLQMFQKFLHRRFGVSLNITQTESGIWRIGTGGSVARAVIELLYSEESAAAGLDRKLLRARQILNGEAVTAYESPVEAIIIGSRQPAGGADTDAETPVVKAQDWRPSRGTLAFEIVDVPVSVVESMCVAHHGYGSAGKIATYAFAVMENGRPVAAFAWQPPPLGSAQKVCPEAPEAVLSLSRMVSVPKSERQLRHISKALRYQMHTLIDRTRWPILVTYSDEGQGHTGHTYKCSGWTPTEKNERVFYVDSENRRVSIPTSDSKERSERDLHRGGNTVLQRWEHRVCAGGDAANWMAKHGWHRVATGKLWRSGNPAFAWTRDDSSAV